jgi:thiol-disulfide isomerase/thioredoxin
MTSREIITNIKDRKEFFDLLSSKNSMLVIKFGAEWCGPCKKIEKLVNDWFAILPSTVKCGILDADESFELFAFLKTRKIVTTIPAILRYDEDNDHWAPNDCLSSSDFNDVNAFFDKILKEA